MTSAASGHYDVICSARAVLRDTIQPFPSFSEIHAAAIKTLRAQIASGHTADDPALAPA